MAVIGSLEIQLLANMARLQADMNQAKQSVGGAMSSIESAAGTAMKALGGLSLGLGLNAVILFAKRINDGVDALNDLKDATGASIENISALEDIARRTGGGFETVSTSLIKFNNVLNSAKVGSDAEQVLKSLGLSAKELKELDPADALLKTATAFSTFADNGNKARGMQELFGKSTKDVAAFLKDLADKGKLNATVTTEQADEAEKFNHQLFAMQKNVTDISRAFTGPLITAINDVIKKFREGRAEGKSFFDIASQRYSDNLREFNGLAPAKGRSASGQMVDMTIPAVKPTLPAVTEPPKGSGGAPKIDPQIKAYEQLIASIREKIRANNEEIALGRKLTDSEKQVLEVQTLLANGSISARDAISAKTKAELQELAVSERVRESNAANLELEKTLRDEKYKTVDAMGAANAASLEQNKALADEVAMIGLSNEAQHALTQARLYDVIGIKEQNLARLQSAEFMSKEQIALEEEIRLLKEKAALQGQKFDRSAEFEKLTELGRQSKQFTDDLERGLTDSLFRAFESGKGFFRTLWDGIKNLFKTTALKLIVNAVVGGTGIGGGTMASAANSVLGGDATSSATGIVSTISKAYSAVTGGFASLSNSVAFAAQDIGVWLQANTTGALNKAGTSLMQSSSALGSVAASAAGIAAGLAARSLISSGYSMGKAMDTFQKVGVMVVGAINPVLGAIAGAGMGILNRAFGMGQKKTSATGITGSFSADGANVQNFQDWNQKGGWFRSSKSGTNYSAMDGGANEAINKALALTSGAVRTYASLIGLSADAVNGFSQSIRINLLGLSADDAQKAVLSAIGNFGEAMADSAYGAALQSFKQVDETTAGALTRLATGLTSVNTAFKNMGLGLMAASLAGADASSKLVAMAGGLEKFTSQTDAYYTAFYSQTERTANVTRQLTEALGAMGLGIPSTREGFRALVDAQNLMTDAGRTTYSVLLSLAPAFAEISTTVEDAAEALKLMTTSAAGLRQSVAIARSGQLDPAQTLAQQRSSFDSNYGMALSTTGAAQAGYADKLAAALPDLNAALMGVARTREEWAISAAPIFAQSEAIAQRLDANQKIDEVVQELRAVRLEMAGLRAEAQATAGHTNQTARILARVTRDGESLQTVAVT